MSKYQDYWRNPVTGNNNPRTYVKDTSGKKEMLLAVMEKYASKKDSILEIGCNIGRNLNVLFEAGYTNLTGVEINEDAVKMGKDLFPNLKADIRIGAIEDLLSDLPKHDVIFSIAVFEHIPTESEWVFEEIEKKVKKVLITIEDEKNQSWKHFPRNYKEVFKNLTQVSESTQLVGGELDGFITRVFTV